MSLRLDGLYSWVIIGMSHFRKLILTRIFKSSFIASTIVMNEILSNSSIMLSYMDSWNFMMHVKRKVRLGVSQPWLSPIHENSNQSAHNLIFDSIFIFNLKATDYRTLSAVSPGESSTSGISFIKCSAVVIISFPFRRYQRRSAWCLSHSIDLDLVHLHFWSSFRSLETAASEVGL